MEKSNKEIIEALEQIDGVTDIKCYCLINNYGATFMKNGKKHDLRRWANCYGVDCGWDGGRTFEEAIEAIKNE